jgi:integrase
MPVHKRKRNGKLSWYYKFDAPDSTRENRKIVRAFGFATKQEAVDREAARRIEEQKKSELAKAGSGVAAAPPKTLSTLLAEFLRQHAKKKLAPKTIERYKEQSAYLDSELLAMSLKEITPLHLSREWNRLLESGGHHRRTKESRPLSAKTVRNIAGVVSSAFRRAEIWGLVTTNPVTRSEPPVPKKRVMKILSIAQEEVLFESATSIWCLSMFLRMVASTAARRGEVLALRWSDISDDGHAMISRSLTQTNELLDFKSTKSDNPHKVKLPDSALVALKDHRRQQDGFREQIRSALPERPRLGICQSRWHPAEARFSFGISVPPLPKAQASEGYQPSLPAPHARVGAPRYRRAANGGVRPPGTLLASRYGRHLLACDSRPGR